MHPFIHASFQVPTIKFETKTGYKEIDTPRFVDAQKTVEVRLPDKLFEAAY